MPSYGLHKTEVKDNTDRGESKVKTRQRDFPGGTVAGNPPANAGDTGSSPGPGRSRMLRSS